MNKPFSYRRLAVLSMLGLAMLLAACNFPLAQNEQDVYGTAAAQTVSAQLTRAFAASPTAPVLPATSTPAPPTLPPATATTVPSATSTPGCTDVEVFEADVTIPDNTSKAAGESFKKTWRLRNTGTCTWTTDYDLVFSSGNVMGGPASSALLGSVAPGTTVDVSVDLVAPASNGTHRGDWRLRNAKGILFGGFYVQISVGPTATPTPKVHTAKKITVNAGSNFDLDEGDPGASDGTKDAWYHKVSEAEQYIEPQNGAQFKKWGNSPPTFNDCKGAALSGSAISFADIPVGTYVCYKTNQGRYGRVQIEDMTTTTIRLDFRTWE